MIGAKPTAAGAAGRPQNDSTSRIGAKPADLVATGQPQNHTQEVAHD